MGTALKASKRETVAHLMRRADAGDESALTELYADLDASGLAAKFTRGVTCPVKNALEMHSLVEREAWRRELEPLKARLGWESATELERLLIERILVCWHHLVVLERSFNKDLDGMKLDGAQQWERILSKAQKRHIAAIQSLAVVRRLSLPAVQVNIGEKQVNIAGRAGLEAGETSPE